MLREKNAIITGARRGIGRAAVEVFARNGANIWACARRQDDAFEADMSALARNYGCWIKPVYFDLLDAEQTKAAVRQIRKDKQSIDIIVNNAGVVEYAPFQTMTESNLRGMLECNYIRPLLFTQMLARTMSQKGGAIVFLSSTAGFIGDAGITAYGGSKAAVAHAVKVLSNELAGQHIRVNAVAPGLVDTDMKNAAGGGYWQEMVDNDISLNRLARPEEVANVIAFLASDLSSYITGQVIRVDGGMR